MLSKITKLFVTLFLSILIVCSMMIQLSTYIEQPSTPEPIAVIEPLIQNAALPIFLSNDPSISIKTLENLIQGTSIQQIHIYSSDQKKLAALSNSNMSVNSGALLSRSIEIHLQGNFAGSLIVEFQLPEADNHGSDPSFGELTLFSALVSLLVILLLELLSRTISSLRIKKLMGTEHTLRKTNATSGKRIYLVSIYPQLPDELLNNLDARNNYLASLQQFSTKMANIYGGWLAYFSEDRLVYSFANSGNQKELERTMIFTWCITRESIFEWQELKLNIHCRSVLSASNKNFEAPRTLLMFDDQYFQAQKALKHSNSKALIQDSIALPAEGEGFEIGSRINGVWELKSIRSSIIKLWTQQERSQSDKARIIM